MFVYQRVSRRSCLKSANVQQEKGFEANMKVCWMILSSKNQCAIPSYCNSWWFMEQVVWLYLNWCSEDYGGNSPIGTARVCKVLVIGDPDCREKNSQGFVRK
jgi:hypothetical protein